MRNVSKLILLSLIVFTLPVYAEMKVAVLDYQQALLESNAAKKYAVDAEKKFGPKVKKLKKLEEEAKKIQNRLIKESTKLSQADRERLELELNQKAREFQYQSKEINESKLKADREMLKIIKPKLDKAVNDIVKENNFDLVLERGSVVSVKPEYDITRKVIDRLNKIK